MAETPQSLVKTVSHEANATVVALEGEVDLHHSPALHKALVEIANERPKRLVVDLTGVPYIDSSGIGTFVEVFRRVQVYKGKMVFFGLNQRVRGVFEITKLDRFFTICETQEQAASA